MHMQEKDILLEASLKDLLHIMKAHNVVRNIIQSKDVIKSYHCEKEDIKNELNDFKIKLGAFCERAIDAKQKTPYEKVPDFITEENVVELCFALIMTEKFDDIDLIVETRKIRDLLRNVQGENEIVAVKLADFLYGPDHKGNFMKKNIDNSGGLFSRFQYFEILDRILP